MIRVWSSTLPDASQSDAWSVGFNGGIYLDSKLGGVNFVRAVRPGGRFVQNADGTVTDSFTGLQWQKDAGDFNGDGQSGLDDHLSWCQALEYCEHLTFAGHDDWRLPNVRELQSIIEYGRRAPAVDPVFGELGFDYWSSTSLPDSHELAWDVNFTWGITQEDFKSVGSHFYVRAVRNDQ